MQKSKGVPSFTRIFKDQASAISAVQILVSAKLSGKTNKQVLDMADFRILMDQEYLINTSSFQLEVRLKNMARDLKKIDFENLNTEFHAFKNFFEGTRRKSKEVI